ncbi:hypothetical protein P8452_43639 [Trifolium repens]|nr:hypothetical protein P8452_43639 [Trifolium repens]
MDPSNPSHLEKMFMDFMNNGMDEELVRLYFEEVHAQEEFGSSKTPVYTNEKFRRRYQMHKHVFFRIIEGICHDNHISPPDLS